LDRSELGIIQTFVVVLDFLVVALETLVSFLSHARVVFFLLDLLLGVLHLAAQVCILIL
jgi:hypothetical protein